MIAFDCTLRRSDFTFEAAFTAEAGITALFGASGSGKSTAIRLIAGLEKPDRGRISLGETVLTDRAAGVFVPPHKRRIGLVFQDALLLPHLSVEANLTYGRFFTPSAERRISFEPVVEVLGISHLLNRRPETLSGGERQRVAIGRALLASPRLLLMDEPLAALDQARKQEILPFIERLNAQFNIPILYVSHATEEVARLAASVIRLDQGRVVAQGTPAAVLGASGLAQGVARFDAVSILTAPVKSWLPDYGLTILAHPAGEITVPGRIEATGKVRIALQATAITLSIRQPTDVSTRTALAGRIVAIEKDDGPYALVSLELLGGETLRAYTTRLAADQLGLMISQHVSALVKSVAIDETILAGAAAL